MAQQAFKFQKVVGEELTVPLPVGTLVEVLVLAPFEISRNDRGWFASFDFWNNPEDDEAWNNA